jgi:hypothetical protein
MKGSSRRKFMMTALGAGILFRSGPGSNAIKASEPPIHTGHGHHFAWGNPWCCEFSGFMEMVGFIFSDKEGSYL